MFLAFGWAQNDFRIRDLATYIRENLKSESKKLMYETYVQEARRKGKGLGTWRIVVFSLIVEFFCSRNSWLLVLSCLKPHPGIFLNQMGVACN